MSMSMIGWQDKDLCLPVSEWKNHRSKLELQENIGGYNIR